MIKFLSLALLICGFYSTQSLADWRSDITDKYKKYKVESFTKKFKAIPTTKLLTNQEEKQCFQLYDDIDLARSTSYYSAFEIMFAIERSFIFPDEPRYEDFDELNRSAIERNGSSSWLDYTAHDVIVRTDGFHMEALNTPENFLNFFKEMEEFQGAAPCHIDYTSVRKKLEKLKSRVERDLEIRDKFQLFEKRVAGQSIQDLSASDIDFLNSILADTEMALSEVRFAAYNVAGLLLIRSNDGKFFWSKDRENKQKAIYFWEYAALKGQSIDAMLNLFIHQNLIESKRFFSIAESFTPNLNLNKVGLFHLYSPRMQAYKYENYDPTPQNTLRLASYYMRHPAFEWHQKNKLMHKVGILTYAGKNDLKAYVEEQQDEAREQYKAQNSAEKIARWAALIGTTVAALGHLSDGGTSSYSANDIFEGQIKHIDNVMVGAYAISLD